MFMSFRNHLAKNTHLSYIRYTVYDLEWCINIINEANQDSLMVTQSLVQGKHWIDNTNL